MAPPPGLQDNLKTPRDYIALGAPWVRNQDGSFQSPPKDVAPAGQAILFPETIKDGSVGATVFPQAGQINTDYQYEFRECGIVFRSADQSHFYIAGIGGFGRRFFIAKVVGDQWLMLDGVDLAASLVGEVQFALEVSFFADRLTLSCNGATILQTTDRAYTSGQWGLRVHKTSALFRGVHYDSVRPMCFVIMPFKAELDPVYRVIDEVASGLGFQCVRADQRFQTSAIVDDIKLQIQQASVIIVDFTGRNPNVYYEAGLADAWNKTWIALAQTTDDLTFDVRHLRTLIYSNRIGSEQDLEEKLRTAIRAATQSPANGSV